MSIAGEVEQSILRNTEDSVNKITGSGGCKFLAVTTAHASLNGYAFVANTDAVISKFYVDDADALSDYGLSGVTLSAGLYICVPRGSKITDITCASGDVVIYNL